MKTLSGSKSKPRFGWLLLLWFAIIFIWAASGWVLFSEKERGTFGDMFGAVNALFSGLAFATLIYTAWMQREELALQREELAATRTELEGQKIQLSEQTATFALQRFEDSLFALLRTQGEIVSSMQVADGAGNVWRSRNCFEALYIRLKNVHQNNAVYEKGATLNTVQSVYGKFYATHQADLGHYFRHLYHIVKFIKDSPITSDSRKKYTSLVRAQLSGYEHLLLFYNCLSVFGYKKFKPLVEEFALLENMPQNELISCELHLKLYMDSAYGDDVPLC